MKSSNPHDFPKHSEHSEPLYHFAPQLPEWVRSAATRPVAFAQVREDPRVDRALIEACARSVGTTLSVLQIASGGCTAAVLAGLPDVSHLALVDPNPAQLALTRIKLLLLRQHTTLERMNILGHSAMLPAQRALALRKLCTHLSLPEDCCGPREAVATEGLDHGGRYELVFVALRQHLARHSEELSQLLHLRDCAEQQQRIAPGTRLGDALDEACAATLALANLRMLFGEGATRQAAQPFHAHFAARVRHVCSTLPAATNPYLWQMLAGSYPPHHVADWISQPCPTHWPTISWINSTVDVALAQKTQTYHVIHLSNILDWLSPAEATHTLKLAWQALHPGGRLIIRQLNSSLTIPSCAPEFAWLTTEADALHAQDRSFFYARLHLGAKP